MVILVCAGLSIGGYLGKWRRALKPYFLLLQDAAGDELGVRDMR
jgi:hypothetical protein